MSHEKLATMELSDPQSFTKGLKTLRVDASNISHTGSTTQIKFPTTLYDLEKDPEQLSPIDDPEIEERMIGLMKGLMEANDAPAEQFVRLGLAD